MRQRNLDNREKASLIRLRKEVTRELVDDILPFWMEKTADDRDGGFIGQMTHDLVVDPEAPKSLVVHSRILWTFSAAAHRLGDTRYLSMAERARQIIFSRFRDPVYDGYFWWLDARDEPLEMDKKVYGQVFTLYGLSEHLRATGDARSMEAAQALFRLIDAKAFDAEHGGYFDFFDRDWTPLTQFALAEDEPPATKTMNTHLHILEGFTNLYRVWPDGVLRRRLEALIRLHLDTILDPQTGHLRLFFDESWQPLSEAVSFGHDIEASWLLCEAAEVLGDPSVLDRVQQTAIRMAEAVLTEGVDPDGGVIYEAGPEGVIDSNKHWWVQAEAVVGFLNAWEISRRPRFLEAALGTWHYIQEKIIDRDHGEWFWSVTRGGKPNLHEPKVSPWKCPYHNSRMCLEVMARVDKWIGESDRN